FCLPALASLSGKQPYSATFRASWLARSAHTESKALLSSCNYRGGNAHEEILLRCAQKSNHLTNHTDCLCVTLYLLIPLPTFNNSRYSL
ncbi:hypothetical protein HID24_005225, partial [Escherichia coli]|nr:hypothetical protein [Escherichia coli]EFJ0088868.1 hypothetical protein [Escherichia coli]